MGEKIYVAWERHEQWIARLSDGWSLVVNFIENDRWGWSVWGYGKLQEHGVCSTRGDAMDACVLRVAPRDILGGET